MGATNDAGHPPATDRDETPAERLDRNWNEMLQELRVSQTGTQILFAFLLVVPFQDRFRALSDVEQDVFQMVLGLVAVATVCNLAPVVLHRRLFRDGAKAPLVRISDVFVKIAFWALGIALAGAVWLALSVAAAGPLGVVVGSLVAAVTVAGWLVVPMWAERRHGGAG